jgi:hypothetical protein
MKTGWRIFPVVGQQPLKRKPWRVLHISKFQPWKMLSVASKMCCSFVQSSIFRDRDFVPRSHKISARKMNIPLELVSQELVPTESLHSPFPTIPPSSKSSASKTCRKWGKKGKVVPLRSIEAHLGDRRYRSYSFLTSALEGWSGQHHTRPRITPRGNGPR